RYVPGQFFAGKKKLSLENGSEGATVAEGLGFNIMRKTGISVGRAAWVKVYVNGSYKGLYNNVEQVDKVFLEDMGLDHGGFLWKKSELIGGEQQRTREAETSPFKFAWYPFDHSATIPPDMNNVEVPTPSDWLAQAPNLINIPHLLKLAVAENYIANTDALVMKETNYFYYDWSTDANGLDPNFQQPRLYFPWDLDTVIRSPDTGLPIMDNTWTSHLQEGLIDEVNESGTPYGYPTYQADYLTYYSNLLDGALELSSVIAMVNNIESVISADMNDDPYQQTGLPSLEFQRIRDFLTDRTAYVTAQLEALSPPRGAAILDDGFEGTPWDANWNDVNSTWTDETTRVRTGSHAAGADRGGGTGYFTSDALDTSDANAIYVRFYTQKKSVATFTLEYSGSGGWSTPIDLTALGGDDEWLYYGNTITDSNYFDPNFAIRFNAAFSGGGTRSVEVDDVIISKTLAGHTVTATSDANGSVDPNGAVVVDDGNDVTFTATPNTGYEVDTWYLDSNSVQVGGVTYTLTNVLVDHTVNVTFKPLQYTVTATYGANGTVDPNGAIVVNYGQDKLFTASPDIGYEVDTWSVDGNSVQSGGNTYTLTNITADHTLNVTFKIQQFTVTASAGANGLIAPSGAITVNYGDSQLFTATANLGYEVDTWSVDGNSVQSGGTTYTLTNVTADHTLGVTFKIQQFTVTASYGANGSVDPNGAIVKNYGQDQLFTASPDVGYEVDTWSVDGNSVQTGGNTYTLSNITADHTLNVTFKQLQYTVTATYGANGSVDPNGAIVKNYGDDQLFTASPDTGYEVDTWSVDGNSVQTGGNTYTLTNITADHTLNVTFK
ncbi:MAG: InlB B-repeat-containing protein, partial [Planctomycetota bacterium]